MKHKGIRRKKGGQRSVIERARAMRGSLKGEPSILDALLRERRAELEREEAALKRGREKPRVLRSLLRRDK